MAVQLVAPCFGCKIEQRVEDVPLAVLERLLGPAYRYIDHQRHHLLSSNMRRCEGAGTLVPAKITVRMVATDEAA